MIIKPPTTIEKPVKESKIVMKTVSKIVAFQLEIC